MRHQIILLVLSACLLLAGQTFAQKEKPPQGGKPKEFRLPAKKVVTLSNGLRAVLVQYGEIPKTMVAAVVAAGNINEGPQEVWLADLTGTFLKEGTASKSAADLARAAASMGAAISVNVTPDRAYVQGNVLSEFTPDFVRLIADMLQHPLFPASELERLKTDELRQMSIDKSSPRPLAQERFMAVLYGNHPYGRIYPTEEMIKSRTIDQVRNFYARTYGAGRTTVYIVGRFDQEAAERALRDAFAGWAKGQAVTPEAPKPKSVRSIYLIDRPGAPQSSIYMGLPVMSPTDPQFRAFHVMNALLGGSFASRITSNIRENKGYTYSPTALVSTRYHDAYWAEIADVTTSVTGASLKEIFGEINRLQAEAPGKQELEGIQNYLAGIFVLQNSATGGIVSQLAFLDLQGLPDSYLRDAVKNIYAVTPKDVQRLTQSQIRDDEMTIVIVGDRKKVEPQVTQYGKIAQ